MLGVARQDAVSEGSDEESRIKKEGRDLQRVLYVLELSSILDPDGDSG